MELVPPPDLMTRLKVLPQGYLAQRKVREKLLLAVTPEAGAESLAPLALLAARPGSTPPSGGTEIVGRPAVAPYRRRAARRAPWRPLRSRVPPPGATPRHAASTSGPAEGLTRMTCLARIPPTNADHGLPSTGQCPSPSPAGPSVRRTRSPDAPAPDGQPAASRPRMR